MPPDRPYHPKVSRETRLLLTAALVAIAVLWLLARIRFQGMPATPNPIPAVLSQITSSARYDDLAGQLNQLRLRLQPALIGLDVSAVAIRLRDDLIVTLVPPGTSPATPFAATVLAADPASGLVVARLAAAASMPQVPPWTPRRLDQPRYLLATEASPAGVSLRPVFVGSLHAIDSALFTAHVWRVPAQTELTPGTLLFTTDAELVGLAIADRGVSVVVPIAAVLAEADRLLTLPSASRGTLGIDVQAMSPAIAAATGAQHGVVVTFVAGDGPAANLVVTGDVIEAVNGRAVTTLQHWSVRIARLSAGETLALGVRHRGELRDIGLVAAAVSNSPDSVPLGLTLRVARGRIGAEVVRIERASAADRAGLEPGDVITLVADVPAPTPAQVMRALATADRSGPVLIAVTRGDRHLVTTVTP